jgi:hypothetical protein
MCYFFYYREASQRTCYKLQITEYKHSHLYTIIGHIRVIFMLLAIWGDIYVLFFTTVKRVKEHVINYKLQSTNVVYRINFHLSSHESEIWKGGMLNFKPNSLPY